MKHSSQNGYVVNAFTVQIEVVASLAFGVSFADVVRLSFARTTTACCPGKLWTSLRPSFQRLPTAEGLVKPG